MLQLWSSYDQPGNERTDVGGTSPQLSGFQAAAHVMSTVILDEFGGLEIKSDNEEVMNNIEFRYAGDKIREV